MCVSQMSRCGKGCCIHTHKRLSSPSSRFRFVTRSRTGRYLVTGGEIGEKSKEGTLPIALQRSKFEVAWLAALGARVER